MSCIGIWCTHVGEVHREPQPDNLECHFNLWMLSGIGRRRHGSLDCFLDIGVMLNPARELSHINIFVPDQVGKSNIQDLGLVLKNKPELVPALFNEDYGVLMRAQEKTIEVQGPDGVPLFEICVLDLENDVSVHTQFGGSTIRIPIPDHLKRRKHYYRLRLKCPFVDQIDYLYSRPFSSVMEGAFFQTELIDFRVNEKRNLPGSLLETIRQNGDVDFAKTHFFLMREASDDYVFSHEPTGGRQLEKEIWKAYVGEEYSFERLTAYHWKESKPHQHFSVFVKFRSFHCSLRTIFIAVGAIILLGVIAGVLANLLYSLTQ